MHELIQTPELQTFFDIRNLIVGAAFVSLALAISYYLLKRKSAFRWPFVVFTAFYLAAAVSRFLKVMNLETNELLFETVADTVLTTIAVAVGIIIWPMVLSAFHIPTQSELKKANDELRQWLNIVEASDDGIIGNDLDGYVRDWNKGAEKLYGYTKEEIVGQNIGILVPQEKHPELAEVMDTVRAGGTVHDLWTERVTKDNRRVLVSTTVSPITDTNGKIIGCADITRDISVQMRMTQEAITARQLFDSFMQNSPALAWMKDRDGRFYYANKRMCDLLGKTLEEIQQLTATELWGEELAAEFAKHDEKALETNAPVESTDTATDRHSQQRNFISVRFPFEYQDGQRFVGGMAIDISELKQTQKQLEKARDRAVEASALKSAFVANISHEIRTPLSGILGMNELLLATELSDEQRDLANVVQESSQSLLTVLNDVLDLSKIEAGKMRIESEPFDLKSVVADAVRLMTAAAMAKQLELHSSIDKSIPAKLMGDADRIRQILLNLIGNAIKFTPRGSVSVSAEMVSSSAQEACVRFAVTDTGIGIAPEDRTYLFTPFAQVDTSTTRRFGGTGLGLTISRHLVRLMNGDIGLDSEQQKGSTFWFSIPFKLKEQLQDATAGGQPDIAVLARTEALVLVLERNPVLQNLTERQLHSLGLQCHVSRSAAEAKEMLGTVSVDAILMDMSVSAVERADIIKQARALGRQRGTYISVIGTVATAADCEKYTSTGIDDCLVKPAKIDDLSGKLHAWLTTTHRTVA